MRFVFPLACLVLLLLACTTSSRTAPPLAAAPQATTRPASAEPHTDGVACSNRDQCGIGRVCCHDLIIGNAAPEFPHCEDTVERCPTASWSVELPTQLAFDECDDNGDCETGLRCCAIHIRKTDAHACLPAKDCEQCPSGTQNPNCDVGAQRQGFFHGGYARRFIPR